MSINVCDNHEQFLIGYEISVQNLTVN
jgi:hypothetical protein